MREDIKKRAHISVVGKCFLVKQISKGTGKVYILPNGICTIRLFSTPGFYEITT